MEKELSCICLRFSNKKRGKGVWKFNNSLLSDFEYINKVKKVIQEVLNEYNLDSSDTKTDFEDSSFSINYQLLWEMIKPMSLFQITKIS
jgi:hypothetical protein